MHVSSLVTLAAAVTAFGVSIAACSTTNNNAVEHSSAAGESCASTADCQSTLICIEQTCVAGPSTSAEGGTSSGAPGSSGGSSGSPSSSGGSSGGSSSGTTVPEAAPPRLGAIGDYCTSTSECGSGLECIPQAFGSGGGVCDLSSYGLSSNVTGKTCSGECDMASDCCELPVDKFTIGTAVIHECSDLQTIINGENCTSGDTSLVGQACFLNTAYCGTCGTSWSCTANRCVYTAACTQGNTGTPPGVGGCAPWSRLGNGLTTSCNTTTMTCTAPTSTTGCAQASDCTDEAYVNFPGTTAGICKAPGGTGDCVCQTGSCYLACSKDLDCATGYTCDTTTRLCKPVGACTSNTQCATTMGDVLSTCVNGTCTTPCSTDHDCSSSGIPGVNGQSFNGSVCVIPSGMTSGTCQSISNNCTMDSDCNLAGGASAHVFCVTPAAATTTVEVSAITN
jgi:hypothetical protein